MGPIAPSAVEVELSDLTGPIELLLQLDGPTGSSAFWGSPAVYFRKAVPQRQANRPNILLIGLDTLRADALGPWGRKPSLTPNLDRLAERSDVWLSAFTV